MDNIDIILNSLAELKREQREDVHHIHEKLDKMIAEGTPISKANAAKLLVCEALVSKHDVYINRQIGQITVIASVASVTTMILIKIGAFMLSRFGLGQ